MLIIKILADQYGQMGAIWIKPLKATGLMKNTPRNEIKKIRNFTECTIFDIFNETLPFDIDSTLFNATLI